LKEFVSKRSYQSSDCGEKMLQQMRSSCIAQGYTPGVFCCTSLVFEAVALTGIGIVGYLGYKEVIQTKTCGWITIALAAGAFLSFAVAGDLKKRKIDALCKAVLATTYVILGFLACAEIVSSKQLCLAVQCSAVAFTIMIIVIAFIKPRLPDCAVADSDSTGPDLERQPLSSQYSSMNVTSDSQPTLSYGSLSIN
jgi:hypothetical protein